MDDDIETVLLRWLRGCHGCINRSILVLVLSGVQHQHPLAAHPGVAVQPVLTRQINDCSGAAGGVEVLQQRWLFSCPDLADQRERIRATTSRSYLHGLHHALVILFVPPCCVLFLGLNPPAASSLHTFFSRSRENLLHPRARETAGSRSRRSRAGRLC